jgi:hypothetical protein
MGFRFFATGAMAVICALFSIALVDQSVVGRTVAQEPQALIAKIVENAPKKWVEYEGVFTGKFRYSVRTSPFDRLAKEKKPATLERVECGAHGSMESVQREAGGGKSYAFVMNDLYAFELKATGPDKRWLATDVRVKSDVDYATVHMKGTPLITNKTFRYIGPFKACGIWLPDLFNNEGFKITAAKNMVRDGNGVVRFDFTFEPGEAGRKAFPKNGWVILDPNSWWRVCESEMDLEHAGSPDHVTSRWTVDCVLDGDLPVLKKITIDARGTENGKKIDFLTTMEYVVDRKESDPADFRLTAFGLPEPMGMPEVSRGTRWYVWFALAAVGALVGGGIVVMLRRRYSKASAASEARPEMKEGGP